jgi:hypothetical protein
LEKISGPRLTLAFSLNVNNEQIPNNSEKANYYINDEKNKKISVKNLEWIKVRIHLTYSDFFCNTLALNTMPFKNASQETKARSIFNTSSLISFSLQGKAEDACSQPTRHNLAI